MMHGKIESNWPNEFFVDIFGRRIYNANPKGASSTKVDRPVKQNLNVVELNTTCIRPSEQLVPKEITENEGRTTWGGPMSNAVKCHPGYESRTGRACFGRSVGCYMWEWQKRPEVTYLYKFGGKLPEPATGHQRNGRHQQPRAEYGPAFKKTLILRRIREVSRHRIKINIYREFFL